MLHTGMLPSSSVCPPPQRAAARHLDLRLAESYIPGVLLWSKCMIYACIVPAYYYSGPSLHIVAACAFLVSLYYDHVYFDPYPGVVCTTSVVVDVVASCLVTILLDVEGCILCQFISGLWFIGGCVHVVWSPHMSDAQLIPLPILHLMCVLLLISLLSCASPNGSKHALNYRHELSDIVASFVRSAVYSILVVADVYLLRGHVRNQESNNKIYMFRYGHVLFAPFDLGCGFGLLTFLVQGIRIYKAWSVAQHHLPSSTNVVSGDVTTSSTPSCTGALLTPAQFRGSAVIRNQSPAKLQQSQQQFTAPMPNPASISANNITAPSVASLDLMEAFRLAKQQYNASAGGNLLSSNLGVNNSAGGNKQA